MIVKELKEKLSKYPDDMSIVIDGYEGGVDDMDRIKEVEIVRNVRHSDYEGPHDILIGVCDSNKNKPHDLVLYFPR